MARSIRQSKILEIISTQDIETQNDLVSSLRAGGYDVTQATISRDIKELGLIRILSGETGKYKYAIVENESQAVSNKYISILKECVISIKSVNNFVIFRTFKSMATAICAVVDKFNLDNYMGAVCGDDTVMVIFPTDKDAITASSVMSDLMEG